MSTPPNPPSTPAEPPTEPAQTPTPETASIPAPAQPLSLDKAPATEAPATPPAAGAPEATEAPAAAESPAPGETPAPAEAPAAPAPETIEVPAAPAAHEAPASPADSAAPEAPAAPVHSAAPEAPAAPVHSAAPEAPAAPGAASPFATPAPGSTPSPFATPAPGAPGAPTVPGAPTAPGMPGAPAWGQPAWGAGPYGGYPQQPKPAGNGLAVAAVIVASFGVMTAVVPFLFWAGALLAVVATGLGIGAVVRANNGAPNKTMAVVGTVLGVLGLAASIGGFFITAAVVEDSPGRYDRGIDIDEDDTDLEGLYPSGEPWPSKSPSPSQVPGLTSALPFGETFTYPNGVKVSLSAPTKYEPKGIIARERVKNAIQLTVTITNGSSAPHEVIYAMPNVRDEQGMTADMVFDSGGSGGSVPKMIKGSILPGASASGVVAFEVPEGTKSITADISAGTLLDDVKYAGPIG
ncbi:hypothetical protein ACFVFI_20405 [Streptomyces sp. NPDC057705]|uniref:DUF4190 domain-containing protein n=1 Tax=Streptomyces sp. NPDC057705 TaxID=3346222 RepID=UPI0036AEA78B